MNVLVIASRFPWPAFSGDRLRTAIWLDALTPHANVALVAPAGPVPPEAPRFHFEPAHRSLARGMHAMATVMRKGLPRTTLLTAASDWQSAIQRARHATGPFDATVVILSRLDPWVRHLAEGRRILDAIDSLGQNTFERSRAAESSASRLWFREARRVARAESEAVHAYDQVLVVSEAETREMNAIAISNGVVIAPLDDAPRHYDFAFWGRLSYYANSDAARVLIDEIWPAIRALAPHATLVIGGSHIPRGLAERAMRAGIDVVTPVRDMPAFARNAKIALVPMRFGTGQSTKVLEAAEAGCAIATTTQALKGLPPLAAHATIADDPQTLAQAAVALLRDEPRRRAAALGARAAVERHYARELTLRQLLAVVAPSQVAA